MLCGLNGRFDGRQGLRRAGRTPFEVTLLTRASIVGAPGPCVLVAMAPTP